MERSAPKKQRRAFRAGWLAPAAALLLSATVRAQDPAPRPAALAPDFVHRLGVELRGGSVPASNRFLAGNNQAGRPIDRAAGIHLDYSFQNLRRPLRDGLDRTARQGVGLAAYTFGNRRELGDPMLLYLFQSARIVQITERLSLDYEWQFGLSWGWHPWDQRENASNTALGARTNAYLNADAHLSWAVAPRLDLTAGVSGLHFSSGNTRLPNAGVNALTLSVGAVGRLGGADERPAAPPRGPLSTASRGAVSHELLLFGAWRHKGFHRPGIEVTIISDRRYAVAGASWAVMRALDDHFSVGAALDGVWDGGAGIRYDPQAEGDELRDPSPGEQLALGVSARGDFAMPYFTVSVGLGYNVLYADQELSSFYQMLALKTDLTPRTYLHVGYRLQRFRLPNFLMLGVGMRL